MGTTLLINENQKRIILRESVNNEFGDMVKQNYKFVKDVLKMSSQQMGMNFEFLFTNLSFKLDVHQLFLVIIMYMV